MGIFFSKDWKLTSLWLIVPWLKTAVPHTSDQTDPLNVTHGSAKIRPDLLPARDHPIRAQTPPHKFLTNSPKASLLKSSHLLQVSSGQKGALSLSQEETPGTHVSAKACQVYTLPSINTAWSLYKSALCNSQGKWFFKDGRETNKLVQMTLPMSLPFQYQYAFPLKGISD